MDNSLTQDWDELKIPLYDAIRELKGGRLFITGGTGFFGKWLLSSLKYANNTFGLGVEAVLLSRNPQYFTSAYPEYAEESYITLHQGELRTFEFPKGKFTHVIHAATSLEREGVLQPLNWLDEMIGGTRRVMELATISGAKRVLLTSSGGVYGPQPPELDKIPEDYRGAGNALDLSATYCIGKRTSEHLCCQYGHQAGFTSVVARCFSFVGPYLSLDQQYAIGNFVRDALYGDEIVVQGDGSPVRSYLYAADLAIWLWKLLLHGQSGRCYHVGSDRAISIAELARLTGQILAPEKKVVILEQVKDGGSRSRYVPSVDRCRQELDLDTWTSLENAILKTARWHQNKTGPMPATALPESAKPAYTYVIDIDGVIATLVQNNDYAVAEPIKVNIQAINRLWQQGHRIVLFTARGSGTGLSWQEVTHTQLHTWGVRYHELRFGKPAADYYVDDRALSPELMRSML